MKSILSTKVRNNTDLTFTWNIIKNGSIEEVELIDGGRDTLLTEENKYNFVDNV
jgi:hypothetical protein